MNPIPADWALSTTHIASEYVSCQFSVLIGVGLKVLPPIELDVVLLMACSKLARTLAKAYRNPGTALRFVFRSAANDGDLASSLGVKNYSLHDSCRIVKLFWNGLQLSSTNLVLLSYGIFLEQLMQPSRLNDMMVATVMMSGPLGMSITHGAVKDNKWHTHESNFQSSDHGLTPGCINLSPAWFFTRSSGDAETGSPYCCCIESYAPQPLLVFIDNPAGPGSMGSQ
ncbi:hypothetical protein DFJ58DRAFT_842127 [Suillus subalutaceus]|uniref:uncharacterized protein n=1 Tax=Suillus subalutaceus TaxID=48586 RepID=UPI001B873FDF|nr:uncharacterized protein DFJ58DRAFT_842127 [Suillus subalutaceus]KAG1851422.1 hypothetical protein DFJ58DRAFT_842127 [Suillus subalutaceus]